MIELMPQFYEMARSQLLPNTVLDRLLDTHLEASE
jgi:hypothetical protein